MYNDFTNEEFQKAYSDIYNKVTENLIASKENKCAYFLGGQPGAGKSFFYSYNDIKNDYIVIDGDEYRKYHPHYKRIVKYDIDNLAERTQTFSNKVVEKLINDLSEDGYNICIEGTLRDYSVPISTCTMLNKKGYSSSLVVIACDAEKSWESTLQRADFLRSMKLPIRLVPVDKYDIIVNCIADNLDKIVEANCFSSIKIVDRDNKMLYNDDIDVLPSNVLKENLNLERWNANYKKHYMEYVDKKIELLNYERKRGPYEL